MTLRLWPRSLAARTALVLLVGLAVVQVAGLTIHALDRIDVQHLAQARYVAVRVVGTYRAVMMASPAQREAVLAERSTGLTAELSPFRQRLLRVNLNAVPLLGVPHWRELRVRGGPDRRQLIIGLRLPEGPWLNVSVTVEPARPWHSPTFLAAFLLMTAEAAGLTLWAVRRLRPKR